MKSLSTLASLALCGATSTAALAQSLPAREQVVITGTPIVETNQTDDFAGFSTVVTDEQVRQLGALDLAAALRMTPGVQISRYNEVGSYSGDQGGNVYIRGLGASRPGSEIKTYVDGLPVYMGVWNHPLMDTLPLNGMARIAVHKGPQPRTTGNDFASIDLTSRRADGEGFRGEATASMGSFGTHTLQASLVGRRDAIDVLLAAGHVESDGDRPNADGRLQNAMGRLGIAFGGGWSASAGFLAVRNEVGDPGDNRFARSTTAIGPYSFSNGVGRNEGSMARVSAELAHERNGWSGTLRAYHLQGNNDLRDDANWGSFNSHFRMSGFRWLERIDVWQGGQIDLGIDQDTVTGRVSGPHVGAPVGTPFGFGVAGSADVPGFRVTSGHVGISQQFALQAGWSLKPSAGLRQYDSNHHDSGTSPHLGLRLERAGLAFYANHSVGLLYPGAETYALTRAIPMAFSPNNGWDRLQATRDTHDELGVQWQATDSLHVDASAFQDDISKRYVWTGFYGGAIANPASGTWSNGFADYRVRGLELSARMKLTTGWSAFVGITTLDASLANLPYVPATAYAAGLSGQVGGFHITLDAQHQSSMYSLTQDRGSFSPNPVPALTVANTRVSYALTGLGSRGEVFAVVNNLLDEGYAYNAGYPMPGRNVRIGITASF